MSGWYNADNVETRTFVAEVRGRMMTRMLEQAFAEVAKLPEAEQDAFASWIVEELASERRWSQSFAQSQDALAHLAEEALAEHRAGRTQPLDTDEG